MDVFRRVGENPQLIKIEDKFPTKFWFYNGERITDRAYHYVVLNGGRVYDKITGPQGMLYDEYIELLKQSVKICPITTEVK